MNKIASIIKDIELSGKVNYDEIFKDLSLNDLDVLSLIVYCYKNNINIVEEKFDINYEEMHDSYYSDAEIVDYFDNYLESEEDYGDDVLNSYSKIVLEEAIKNTKINFSMLDIKQEGLFAMVKFRNEFYEKLSQNYDEEVLKYILRYYVKKAMVSYQKKELSDIEEKEYVYLLYVKIQSELNEGEKLVDILNRIGITEDYYNELKEMFGDVKFELSYDDIIFEMERVKKKFDIAMNTNKINYVEENALSIYLGLEGHKHTAQEISEENDLRTKNVDKLIKNAIFKLSLVFNIQILDELERLYSEMEELDAKLS